MAVQIPFPLPSAGYAMNSKVRVNLDYLVDQFNQFNTGTATWDNVSIGTANNLTGTLTFYNASNAFYLTIKAGATAANTTYTLPTALPTPGSGILVSSNAGIMSWLSATGGFLTSTTAGVISSTGAPSVANAVPLVSTLGAVTFSAISYNLNGASNGLAYVPAGGTQLTTLANGLGVTSVVSISSVGTPAAAALTGTANQITITPSAGAWTFATPQDLATSSNVEFARIKGAAGSYASPAFYFASSTSNTVGLYTDGTGTALNIRVGAAAGSVVWALDNSGNVVAVGETRSATFRATTNYQLSTGAGPIVTLNGPASGSGWTFTFPTSGGTNTYVLSTNGSGTTSWVSVSAAGGATTALDNLAAVAINTALLPGTTNSIALGSGTKQWSNVFSTAGTFENNVAGTKLTWKHTTNSVTGYLYADSTVAGLGSFSNHPFIFFTNFGAASLTLGTTAFLATFAGQVQHPNGSAGTPSMSFTNSPTTGFYYTGSNNKIGVSNNGTLWWIFNTDGNFEAQSTARITNRAGSAASPSYTFPDGTSGLFSLGTNNISLSTNSAERLSITSGGAISLGGHTTPMSDNSYDVGSGSLRWRTGFFGSNLIVGLGAARVIGGVVPMVEVEGTTAAEARPSITLNINSAAGCQLMLARSRGTTNGAVTILQNNDYIGGLSWLGANGVDMSAQGAYIYASINGTPSSTSMPTRLEFATTPVGSIGATVALTIDATQKSTFSGVVDMASHKITSLSNGTTSTDAAAFGQIKVIQVVSFTTSTRTTTTANTFQSTSLTVSITPSSASNKVLVMASGSLLSNNGTIAAIASIFRDSTNLNTAVTNNYGFGYPSLSTTGSINTPWSGVILDSPATTSAVAYSVKVRNDDNVTTARFGDTGVLQSIVVMEVAP